jgi:uncharacterized membrane protein YbhN (UPF0104 family)
MYLPSIFILLFIYDSCMLLCGKKLPFKEKFLLTSYSSIANFFGPLQSGPGVRAVYLKAKHNIRIRDYTLATLLYYAMYAFISAFCLLVGTRPWWQTVLALLAVAGLSTLVLWWFTRRDKTASESHFKLRRGPLITMFIVTLLQVLLTTVIYFTELRAVNHHISFGQAVSYTGAANFALFVSLTPGAIGFRETFLEFSRHLHHVQTPDILSANLIDRAAYIIFLLVLFVVVLSLHAGRQLDVMKHKGAHKQAKSV